MTFSSVSGRTLRYLPSVAPEFKDAFIERDELTAMITSFRTWRCILLLVFCHKHQPTLTLPATSLPS